MYVGVCVWEEAVCVLLGMHVRMYVCLLIVYDRKLIIYRYPSASFSCTTRHHPASLDIHPLIRI